MTRRAFRESVSRCVSRVRNHEGARYTRVPVPLAGRSVRREDPFTSAPAASREGKGKEKKRWGGGGKEGGSVILASQPLEAASKLSVSATRVCPSPPLPSPPPTHPARLDARRGILSSISRKRRVSSGGSSGRNLFPRRRAGEGRREKGEAGRGDGPDIPGTGASRSQILILGRTKSLHCANRLGRTCTTGE